MANLHDTSEITKGVIYKILVKLSRNYSIDLPRVKYVLNDKIQEDLKKCLDLAVTSFVTSLSNSINLNYLQPTQLGIVTNKLEKYLGSDIVTEEVLHLLEPGMEFFDRGKLAKVCFDLLIEDLQDLRIESILNAWGEFLKAFSFASRSTPELREFLRASYEAGSFKTLSNIEDVLEKMNSVMVDIYQEELGARESIKDYSTELEEYKTWAVGFLN
jgi:hypothetical protein